MAAKTTEPLLVAIAAMFTPTFAFAHTGVGEASGFLHGFGHPISGLDHILAMVMVSFFAWQLGGRALWFVPVVFVALMAIGGALGVVGVELRVVEVGLALSSVVLGVIVALGTKPPLAAAMSIVGFFAMFHGYVHGADNVGRRRRPRLCGGLRGRNGFTRGCRDLPLLSNRGKTGEHYSSLVVRAAGGLTAVAGIGILATRL